MTVDKTQVAAQAAASAPELPAVPSPLASPPASPPAANPAAASAAPVERWLLDHGDILWRFILSRVRSHEAAEDIVQECILAAMKSHATFAGTSSERTWLLGIAAHKIADHFRAARRRAGTSDPKNTDNSSPEAEETASMFTPQGMWARPPVPWTTDARSTTENVEILATLRRCIDTLPPSQAEAVWLRDILDIPGDEVCKAMGITPTNLWSRMHRARAALRSCVEKAMGISKEGTQ